MVFVAGNGELSERSKEPVLKTGDVKASVGSNPTLSSMKTTAFCRILSFSAKSVLADG